jgi:tripeptidyl-peptidase-1
MYGANYKYTQGIPDVSAQGDNFRIFYQGAPHLIGGTSASTPAFAGFVSLLNDVLLSKKLPPLGFLNPLLYSKGLAGLNDITTGNNPGCGTQGFNVGALFVLDDLLCALIFA